MITVTLVPVQFDSPVDMSQWYAIRTEAGVRAGCRSAKKITPDQHRVWWEQSRCSPTIRSLYFILAQMPAPESHQVRPVGIVRLDRLNGWTEVWIAIKSEHRHKGVATLALAWLKLKAEKAKWPPLGAVVNGQKNLASWRLFTHAGFVPMKKGFIQLIQKGRP